jgi:translation elongation factor EF-1beta
VNKETLEAVGFGLDLVHLAVNLGRSESPGTTDVPAEVEQIEGALRKIAVRKLASEPQE